MDLEKYEVRATGPRATILLVDDALICRELISNALRQEGYAVCTAGNGQEGLAALQQVAVQLIILDNEMPLMDGLTFLRHLRDNRDWASLPVIMLAGSALMETVLKAREFGAAEYLLKAEFSLDRLLERVRKWLPAGY